MAGLVEETTIASLEDAAQFIRELMNSLDSKDTGALEATTIGFGSYEGLPPQVELLSDGRLGRLLSPIGYTRPNGERWPVPEGASLDGASIPRPLWSVIGGPFEGRYRDASIVHDHYCVVQTRAWRDTHRMFFEAMRCSGVGAIQAKVMFYAVHRFGPRWSAPGLESFDKGTDTPSLRDTDAQALANDAEAIVKHDLNIDEIEALADIRTEERAAGGAKTALESHEATASLDERRRLLVVVGGSGDAHDHAAVVKSALKLPGYVVDRFYKKGIRILACRDSVTDFERSLHNVTPRGWEETGRTWDSVPGAYFDGKKRVVIATVEDGGARAVPDKSAGLHGSDDLVIHESLHGYDYAGNHAVLADPRFTTARDGDLAQLSDYESQAGQAGLEETFAETGARHVTDSAGFAGKCPHLASYWAQGPEPTAGVALETMSVPGGALGTAELTENGSIVLDLRAEGDDGAIGHAQLIIADDDPAHGRILEKAFAGSSPALESTGRRKVLFLR